MEITCPSGLRGTIRKLKVKEQGQLLRQVGGGKGADRASRLGNLLDACWVDTMDRGIYRWDGARPSWADVLSGDRLYCLMQIRACTFGSKYDFPVRCGNAACREQFKWTVDLNELPVQPLPKPSKELLLAGKPFQTFLADGTPVLYHLPTGRDESRKPDPGLDVMSSAVAQRVDAIGDVRDRKKLIEVIGDLDADELDGILAAMQAADCGVETGFEVQCPHCDALTNIDLPFDQTFWLPQTAGRRLPTL